MSKLRPNQRLAMRIAIAYGLDAETTLKTIDRKLPEIPEMDVDAIRTERRDNRILLSHADIPSIDIEMDMGPLPPSDTLDPYGDRNDILFEGGAPEAGETSSWGMR